MTIRRLPVLAVLVVFAAWMLMPSSPAQQKEARPEVKWEYKTVQMSADASADQLDKQFNALGTEGWELTVSNFVSHANRPGAATYVFKRAKR